jgi:hypothetical protein
MTLWCLCAQTESISETLKPDAPRTGSLIRRVESIAKPAETATAAWPFLVSRPTEDFQARGGERIVIFNHEVAPGRNAAIRAGWNDAAWGRPQRDVETSQAPRYERGYAGGLDFRQKQQSDMSERGVVSSTLPRVAPTARAQTTRHANDMTPWTPIGAKQGK